MPRNLELTLWTWKSALTIHRAARTSAMNAKAAVLFNVSPNIKHVTRQDKNFENMRVTGIFFPCNILKSSCRIALRMHEWALAEAVVTAASEIDEKQHLKEIIEVRIKVGQLQQIDDEIFKFALEQVKTVEFKNTIFRVESAKATLKCRSCNKKWFFDKDELDENTAESIPILREIAHTYISSPT